MEYLYEELRRLRCKLLSVKDPNARLEIEYEIANIKQEIEEEKGQ